MSLRLLLFGLLVVLRATLPCWLLLLLQFLLLPLQMLVLLVLLPLLCMLLLSLLLLLRAPPCLTLQLLLFLCWQHTS